MARQKRKDVDDIIQVKYAAKNHDEMNEDKNIYIPFYERRKVKLIGGMSLTFITVAAIVIGLIMVLSTAITVKLQRYTNIHIIYPNDD